MVSDIPDFLWTAPEMGAGDEAYMTELRCRHPCSQWETSLAPAMLPFFFDAWRESPDLLDAPSRSSANQRDLQT
jgi:hypothetical protein